MRGAQVIDHILTYASEAAAHTALDPLGYGSGGTTWDTSRVVPGVIPITVQATYNADGTIKTPATTLSGFWILIALPALDNTLKTIAGGACRLIVDRSMVGSTLTQAKLYSGPAPNTSQLLTSWLNPIFAGSSYVLGA